MSTTSTCPPDPQPGQAGYMTADRVWNAVWTPANYFLFGPIGGEWLKKGYGKVKSAKLGWTLLPQPTPSKELARILILLGSKESMMQLIEEQKKERKGDTNKLQQDVEQGLPAKEVRIMKLVMEASPILTLLRSITTTLLTPLPLSPDEAPAAKKSKPRSVSYRLERIETILQSPEVERTEWIQMLGKSSSPSRNPWKGWRVELRKWRT